MECSSNKVDTMVASLQSRRKALESKITEKNRELKRLCIQEAELTGSLPPEIPLDPGETPPTFRRRVGTSFTYPENLINKLKFKDDETLASLELEYKIQKGIAEAALGLANDETANKSVRRKHRMMYQQSQNRIIELETRINLCNNQKVKKKPRPESSYTTDFVNNHSVTDGNFVVPKDPIVQSLNPKVLSHKSNLRQSQSYNKFPGQRNSHDPRIGNGLHNAWNTHEHISSSNMQPMLLPRSTISLDKDHVTYPKDNGVFFNNNSNSTNLPSSHELSSKIIDQDSTSKYRDRFGSLDRRHTTRSSSSRSNSSVDHEPSAVPVVPRHTNSQHPTTTILLPNQMYPENSLMRTHSLGNIKNENQQQPEKGFTDLNQISLSESRKNSEKKWIETSLDSSSVESGPTLTHDLPPPIKMHTPPIQPENHPLPYDPLVNHFDTVPFESPKNHTVVQVGKWQPYREVTKPFEMSDFYKYSTRFRKPSANSINTSPEIVQATANPSPTPSLPPPLQNKGIYQPLQPHNCHPLVPQNISLMEETVCPIDSFEPNNELCLDESVFANEMLSWYQDEATPQSRTATLV
ncbi:FERM domain-containing protein 4A [Myzus persicae]|uniref:FERM domain-containing protein 4A n=1 Tax=Myzus persicae TaxID=13164 RepID=UPI000B93877F|nr:FERM domain-containing protein 4A [Myzus persicae]